MADMQGARQRVRAYLDEMDRVAAAHVRDAYADEVHVFNDRPLRRSDLRALLGPARDRWVGCDRYASSHDVVAYVHLVREGEVTTACGATASSPDVWEPGRYRHRPKCTKCLTAEEARRG